MNVNTQSWLWPDHNIGLRESRKLREKHNALVNSHAALVSCVKLALHRLDHRGTLADVGVDRQQYESALALAKEVQS